MFSIWSTTTGYVQITPVQEFDNAKFAVKPVSDPHPTHAPRATPPPPTSSPPPPPIPSPPPPPPPTMCTECLETEGKCMVATLGKLEETETWPYDWSPPKRITCKMLVRNIKFPKSLKDIDYPAILALFPEGWDIHPIYRAAALNFAAMRVYPAITNAKHDSAELIKEIARFEASAAELRKTSEVMIIRELAAKQELMKTVSEVFAKWPEYLTMNLEQAQTHFTAPSSKTPELLKQSEAYLYQTEDKLPDLRTKLAETNAEIERLTTLNSALQK